MVVAESSLVTNERIFGLRTLAGIGALRTGNRLIDNLTMTPTMKTRDASTSSHQCCTARDRRHSGSRIRSLLDMLRARYEHARRRRELLEMPDYLLKDMGVTREDLYRESHKPFRRP